MGESTATLLPKRPRSLPRGRHNLSRADVESDQRLRILLAFAPAMAETGYVDTPVAAIIRSAGVSRETYYRLFTDKLDGFLSVRGILSIGSRRLSVTTSDSSPSTVPRPGCSSSRPPQPDRRR